MVKFDLPAAARRKAPSGHIVVIAGHRRCRSKVARPTESSLPPGRIAHWEFFVSFVSFCSRVKHTMHPLFAKADRLSGEANAHPARCKPALNRRKRRQRRARPEPKAAARQGTEKSGSSRQRGAAPPRGRPSADGARAPLLLGPAVRLFLNVDFDRSASHPVTKCPGDGFQL